MPDNNHITHRPTPAWEKIIPIIPEVDASKIVRFHQHELFHSGQHIFSNSAETYCNQIWKDIFNKAKKKGTRAFKIEDNDGLAGFIVYGPAPTPSTLNAKTKCAAIQQLYIKSIRCNRGYGTNFLNYASRQLEDNGFDTLLATAAENNKAAHNFFSRRHAVAIQTDKGITQYAINLRTPEKGVKPFMKATQQAIPA